MSKILFEIDQSIKRFSLLQEGAVPYLFVGGAFIWAYRTIDNWIEDKFSYFFGSSEPSVEVINSQSEILDSVNDNLSSISSMGFSTLFAAVGMSSVLLVLNMNRKGRILNFEFALDSTRQMLISSGFLQVNQIYDTAKRIQTKHIQTCRDEPETDIIEKLMSYFTVKLNCTISAIIEYAIYVMSQLFILYFSIVKKQNPNIKVFKYTQILEYDIPNGKIFKERLVYLNEQLQVVLNIIYKDKQSIDLMIARLDKVIKDAIISRN